MGPSDVTTSQLVNSSQLESTQSTRVNSSQLESTQSTRVNSSELESRPRFLNSRTLGCQTDFSSEKVRESDVVIIGFRSHTPQVILPQPPAAELDAPCRSSSGALTCFLAQSLNLPITGGVVATSAQAHRQMCCGESLAS